MLLDDDSNLEDHLVCKHEHGGLRYLIVLYQRSYHDTDVQSANQRPYLVLVR